MKRLMPAIATLALLHGVPAGAAPPEPQFPELNRVCGPLAVREAPDAGAAVLFELPEGTRIRTGNRKLDGRTTWINIRTKDGRIGWADGSLMCEGPYGLPPEIPLDAAGNIEYREVVEVLGVEAEELYRRAKVWLAIAYRSAPDVLKLDDAVGGTIVVKGIYPLAIRGVLPTFDTRHALTLEFKDGRYRATVNQLESATVWGFCPAGASVEECVATRIPGKTRFEILKALDAEIRATFDTLKNAMEKNAPDDEW